MKPKIIINTPVISCLLLLASAAASFAASVSLTANDPSGSTSFNAAGNWSNGAAPSSANDYFTSTFLMRTPTGTTAPTFAGNSLTLQNGSSSGGTPFFSLIFKGSGLCTYTINNFTNASGAGMRSGSGSGDTCVIAGNHMTIAGSSTIEADQSPFVINSPLVGGTGVILTNLNPAPQTYGTVTYNGTNSAFTGSLYLGNNGIVVFGNPASGPGNPTIANPGQITTLGAVATLRDNAGVILNNANGGITLGGALTINTVNAGTNMVIGETITDNGSGYALTKTGAGTLTLAGNNSFGGGFTLSGATAGSQLDVNSASALGTGTFTISGGTNAVIDNTSGTTVTVTANNVQTWDNSLTFLGSSSLNLGSGTVTMGGNLAVTVSNNNFTVGEVVDNGAGYTLTKNGPGTLTLTGGGAYYGSTVINNGVLALAGSGASLACTNISLESSNATLNVSGADGLTLATSQTLSGNGTVVGTLSDGSGTIIEPGGTSVAGTLVVNGNLTFNGAGSLAYFLAGTTTPGGGTNSLIVVSGTLNAAGPTPINLSGLPATGTYTVIQYGTFSGSVANFTVPSGFVVTNNTSINAIQVTKTQPPANLVWEGDGAENVWDTGITPNWLQSGTNQVFNLGDNVSFTDSGSDSPSIDLTGTISPGSTAVNSTQSYDFTGSGISSGDLVKSGTGTLILENNNTYSGLTVINGGTLQIGNPNTGGTSGSLGSGSVSNNASLVFDLSEAITVANTINGTGSLTEANSSGATALTASNSYTGGTLVEAGFLDVQNSSALGAPGTPATVDGGGTLYVNLNINVPATPLILNGSGPTGDNGALEKGGGGASTLGGAITLASDSTISLDGGTTLNLTNSTGINGVVANANFTLTGGGSSTGAISGSIVLGTGGLTVSGGVWTVASNNFSGGDFLNGGSLRISSPQGVGSIPSTFNASQVNFSGGALEAATNVIFNDGNIGFYLGGNGTFIVDSNATLTVSNQISGGGSLIKASPGTLVLNGSNDFSGTLYVDTGSTTASDGITSITTSNALAGVPVSPGTATIVQQDNNSGYSTLQLNGTTGPINLSQEISMDCRNTTNPNLDNVAGNNYLGGNIDIYQGGSSVYLQADAGTLTLAGNLQYVGALANPRAFTFQGRGNFVVTGQILAATTVVAPVSVQMSGTGILTLSGNNTYESSTTVSSGELLLLGSINSTNGLTAAGGDLAGTGMINDNVTIQALGSLTPGLGNGSIGTLTISSNLTLAGLASMDINKSTHASDQVTGLASIMYGGTLAVTNLAGTLVLGDSFTLFSAASSSGNFASVVGNPGSGLAYRFNPTNGVVSVITGTASNPTNITASVSGRTLTLTWPEDHLGWILQSETNAASIGLGTNFVDVAGSSASTNAIFTINPLNPTVFFRLRHP